MRLEKAIVGIVAAGWLGLAPAALFAAGPKSGPPEYQDDDLTTGSAGSVDLSGGFPNVTTNSGSLGQVGNQESGAGIYCNDAGYFSMFIASTIPGPFNYTGAFSSMSGTGIADANGWNTAGLQVLIDTVPAAGDIQHFPPFFDVLYISTSGALPVPNSTGSVAGIARYDVSGNLLNSTTLQGDRDNNRLAALDSLGNIYVAEYSSVSGPFISKYAPTLNFVKSATLSPDQVGTIQATASDGNFFYVVADGGRVETHPKLIKFDSNLVAVATAAYQLNGLNSADAIALDGLGYVYAVFSAGSAAGSARWLVKYSSMTANWGTPLANLQVPAASGYRAAMAAVGTYFARIYIGNFNPANPQNQQIIVTEYESNYGFSDNTTMNPTGDMSNLTGAANPLGVSPGLSLQTDQPTNTLYVTGTGIGPNGYSYLRGTMQLVHLETSEQTAYASGGPGVVEAYNSAYYGVDGKNYMTGAVAQGCSDFDVATIRYPPPFVPGSGVVYAPIGSAVPYPASPAFSLVTDSTITANWIANGSPAGTLYYAQISTASDFSAVLESSATYNLSATFAGLSALTTYYVQVAAYQVATSTWGPYGAIGSTVTLPVPLAPYGLTVSNVGTAGFTLSWSTSSNGGPSPLTGYYVEVATNSAFAPVRGGAQVGALSLATTNFFLLDPFTTYYAHVRAFDAAGDPSPFSAFVSTQTLASSLQGASNFGAAVLDGNVDARQPSLAADQNGNLHLAYYDDSSYSGGKVFYSSRTSGGSWGAPVAVGQGIPAGTNVDAFLTKVDPSGVSLAAGADGGVHVAFFSTAGLVYAKLRRGVLVSSTVVDNGLTDGTFAYSSIGVDGAGNPRIAYSASQGALAVWTTSTTFTGLGGALQYARFDGVTWTTQIVDAAAKISIAGASPTSTPYEDATSVEQLSMALDGAGNPRIAYYDSAASSLRYASFNGSAWAFETVDGPRGSVVTNGAYDALTGVSLALDGSGRPYVSYQDYNTQELFYAAKPGGAWSPQKIVGYQQATQTGPLLTSSLALDGLGHAGVAFQNVTPTTHQAAFAWQQGGSFNIQTVDPNAGAFSVSLALDGSGAPHIAYSDSFSYSTATLHYASAPASAFALTPPMGGSPRGKAQAPDQFAGTVVSSSSVAWSWTPHSSNHTGFRLYEAPTSTGPFQLVADTNVLGPGANAFTQTGLTPQTSYFAYVAAVNAGGVVTSSGTLVRIPASICTGPFVFSFTDTLVARRTVVRAVHLNELRSDIDSLRLDAGLAPYNWSPPSTILRTTMVRGAYFSEAYNALRDVYNACGQTVPPNISDASIVPKVTVITVAHVQDLRNMVNNAK